MFARQLVLVVPTETLASYTLAALPTAVAGPVLHSPLAYALVDALCACRNLLASFSSTGLRLAPRPSPATSAGEAVRAWACAGLGHSSSTAVTALRRLASGRVP